MVDLGTANGKVTLVKCLHKDTVWKTVTAATCEQGGTENQVCTKCNEVLNTRDTPALGHNFTKKIISESTKLSEDSSSTHIFKFIKEPDTPEFTNMQTGI